VIVESQSGKTPWNQNFHVREQESLEGARPHQRRSLPVTKLQVCESKRFWASALSLVVVMLVGTGGMLPEALGPWVPCYHDGQSQEWRTMAVGREECLSWLRRYGGEGLASKVAAGPARAGPARCPR